MVGTVKDPPATTPTGGSSSEAAPTPGAPDVAPRRPVPMGGEDTYGRTPEDTVTSARRRPTEVVEPPRGAGRPQGPRALGPEQRFEAAHPELHGIRTPALERAKLVPSRGQDWATLVREHYSRYGITQDADIAVAAALVARNNGRSVAEAPPEIVALPLLKDLSRQALALARRPDDAKPSPAVANFGGPASARSPQASRPTQGCEYRASWQDTPRSIVLAAYGAHLAGLSGGEREREFQALTLAFMQVNGIAPGSDMGNAGNLYVPTVAQFEAEGLLRRAEVFWSNAALSSRLVAHVQFVQSLAMPSDAELNPPLEKAPLSLGRVVLKQVEHAEAHGGPAPAGCPLGLFPALDSEAAAPPNEPLMPREGESDRDLLERYDPAMTPFESAEHQLRCDRARRAVIRPPTRVSAGESSSHAIERHAVALLVECGCLYNLPWHNAPDSGLADLEAWLRAQPLTEDQVFAVDLVTDWAFERLRLEATEHDHHDDETIVFNPVVALMSSRARERGHQSAKASIDELRKLFNDVEAGKGLDLAPASAAPTPPTAAATLFGDVELRQEDAKAGEVRRTAARAESAVRDAKGEAQKKRAKEAQDRSRAGARLREAELEAARAEQAALRRDLSEPLDKNRRG